MKLIYTELQSFVPIIEVALAVVCFTIGTYAAWAFSITFNFLSSTKIAIRIPDKYMGVT
jgi:hypothetical protein